MPQYISQHARRVNKIRAHRVTWIASNPKPKHFRGTVDQKAAFYTEEGMQALVLKFNPHQKIYSRPDKETGSDTNFVLLGSYSEWRAFKKFIEDYLIIRLAYAEVQLTGALLDKFDAQLMVPREKLIPLGQKLPTNPSPNW